MSTVSQHPEIAPELRREAAEGMITIGAELHRRGWSLATSSNYSVRLSNDPVRLLVTASGKDKGALNADDFALLDDQGQPVEPGSPKSSAETMLHVVLVREAGAGAVLHTHSMWGTLLSDRFADQDALTISGYEMLKALPGINTHESSVSLPIFPNTQDIDALSRELSAKIAEGQPIHGFLIQKHGLYTWGDSLADARRHLEAIEFLMECEGRRVFASH